eukprot:CAMPEP_0119111030 /NCGR_PEP_ID=MMETSP1180-20130426/33412_1 /TAXON_ID=3052 ORGANISM="Chlamydomonas cf sp, Strain CCMP681" /NCGR_SAMPLE_ID=MMETSP1180 /ASSEMBLY_ACC=CAM_ASM_000741 /LENGTH=82 /DNA_ID=CAMNT_0007097753 /DNA_START=682 /DNA_END=930 /DNA_ORIENTATION=+
MSATLCQRTLGSTGAAAGQGLSKCVDCQQSEAVGLPWHCSPGGACLSPSRPPSPQMGVPTAEAGSGSAQQLWPVSSLAVFES